MNGNERYDAIQVRKTRSAIEWLAANRWRMPGSWERSRLSEIDNPLTRTLPSQPLRRVFCFPKHGSFEIPPAAEAGTGDPDLGARAGMRAPKARGLPEGTRRKPDTDGRANQEGFAMAARRSERCDRIRLSIWFAASRGSTNAGGEDFGYFAPWEKRVRIPPLTSRTVEAALARAVASRVSVLPPGRTCV